MQEEMLKYAGKNVENMQKKKTTKNTKNMKEKRLKKCKKKNNKKNWKYARKNTENMQEEMLKMCKNKNCQNIKRLPTLFIFWLSNATLSLCLFITNILTHTSYYKIPSLEFKLQINSN